MFGSHLSISGGMHNALLRAEELGMDTVQVFTKNQQQWKCKPLESAAITDWATHRNRLKFSQTVSHDSYLINLASPDEELRRKSMDLFAEELRRCMLLEIPCLVTHPGAHMGAGEEIGLSRVAQALDDIYSDLGNCTVTTCLEITAGQGSSLGYRLEHLQSIIEQSSHKKQLGVCLDTAHLFAAGYDFRGRKFSSLMKEIDERIGIDRVKVLHLNDSKKDLGSRVDRHAHIGEGMIGIEGFTGFVREKRFANIPKILETPKEKHPSGKDWDAVNLEVLRGL